MGFQMQWILAVLALVSLNAFASDATLEIVADKERLIFSQSRLLSRSDVEMISVAGSAYERRFTRFKAIPIGNLFRGLPIPELAVVQCNSTDGFSAILDKTRLLGTDPKVSKAYLAIEDPKSPWPDLAGKTASAGPFYLVWVNPKASKAYLAIEDPKSPWPDLAGKTASAGPFYLVWINPEASAIGPEEWPYQIASFHVLSDLHGVFPKIYPAVDAAESVQNGFKSFRKNCLTCHKINGEGAASIGPDLNLPMNPTEYFQANGLVALIRDPASVRTWARRTMRGFSAAVIPDAELSDLIAYLRHMSFRKDKR